MAENDFLTYQLYTASKTPRIRRARIRSWILTTVTFLCLAYLFYRSENNFLGNYFLAIAGLCLVLFPFYSRWRYKRHYLKYIRDVYKNKFDENWELEVDNEAIITRDKTGEMKINKTEIEEINEISDYYFLKAKTGLSLIISKNNSSDIGMVKDLIKSLVEVYGVKHNIELDWKWR